MKKTMKLGLILLAFTAIAAGILGALNLTTRDIIAEVQIQENNQARQEVLAEGSDFEELEASKLEEVKKDAPLVEEIYQAVNGEEIIGYTIKTVISGYSGPIVVMTGIDMEGRVAGMKVVSNTETPGLGANASNDEFQDQFKEKSAESDIELVKNNATEEQVEALTGATITSDAITDSVNEAIKAYNNLVK